MTHTLLDVYGIGFAISFFIYLIKAGFEGVIEDKHGVLTMIAVVAGAALWFIFIPLMIGDGLRVLWKRSQRKRSQR